MSAVVWIAEQFTEEHRKTVDWLNERTNDSLSLYAVQLEVLQIDDSPPAIRFNVISQPNQVVRAATAAKSSGSLTETQQMQLEFWKMFRHRLLEKKVIPSAQTPRPQYWFDVALGRANIFLSNILDTYASRIGVRYIGNRIAELRRSVEKDKKAIEQEIGEKLIWNPTREARQNNWIVQKVDLSNRDAWPEYYDGW